MPRNRSSIPFVAADGIMKKINLGIADDHPIVIYGVLGMLKECVDLHVRFTTDSIHKLLELVQTQPVDVLLCDYEFEDDPKADGLALLSRLRRIAPDTKVLFLSAHSAPYIVAAALDAGAAGFIGKCQAEVTSLPEAIRAVSAGKVYLSSALVGGLLSTMFKGRGRAAGLASLGAKELSVARMISSGLSIAQVAARFHRSPRTISNQKNAAMKKLGAKNDVELAAIMRDFDRGPAL